MHLKNRNISIDLYAWQLQFKILHTGIIGINYSGLCDNCKVAVETTEQLIFRLPNCTYFWVEIERWISEMLQRRIKLDKIKTSLEVKITTDIDLIFILAKGTIYKSRLRGSIPKAKYTKATLRSYLSTLRYTSIINNGGNSQEFKNKWSRILEYTCILISM